MGLTFSRRRRRVWRPRTLVVVAVVLALAVGGFVALRPGAGHDHGLPAAEADRFLRAWSSGDTAALAALVAHPPADLAALATSLTTSAPGSRATYTRTSIEKTATGATAGYHARLDLAGFGTLEWDGRIPFVRVSPPKPKPAVWRVAWTPSILYPGLRTGQHLVLRRTWPARAPILAADGSLLAGTRSIVTVGLEPDRITKTLPTIERLLRRLVGTSAASIEAALHGPGVQPNYFVPVATVPDDARYTTVLRPQLAPIAGVFFHRTQGVLSATGLLTSQLIGRVGEITAERLHQLGPPYRVGDTVGLSGLQAAFETRLAGRPRAEVVVEAGTKPTTTVRTVQRFPGRDPEPVRVTIDPRTQHAAEAALAGIAQPAALVALDTATGGIRAVVSKPDAGFERALDGAYPPGSTFKVITTAALLAAGRTGATPAPCPPELTVDGRKFVNFEGEASSAIDLAHAFAISCNNAFIGLADQLPKDALAKAASSFGFGARWRLPVPAFGGSFPAPTDGAERAASAIGQGRVLASPAQMASVAAAVASGRWHAPVLTTQPAEGGPSGPPLDPGMLASLRAFMASVVAPGGTAAGSGLPADVFGKTGTAEFGPANPPRTHAWFIGYRGDVAFAVIVEGGGVGGRVAAPIAARFVQALGG